MIRRIALFLFAAWAAPVFLMAHGVSIEFQIKAPAVVLRASYAPTEPLAYASVRIMAPGSTGMEFQTGRTDAQGRFAFVPDREGEWRAVVDDELGHREETRIPVPAGFFGGGKDPSGSGGQIPPSFMKAMPTILKAVLGLAVIFGATGFLYGWKARRRPGG